MILLDTHALVWLDAGSPLLGRQAIDAMDQALSDNALAVSAISFWEVAMLTSKGRLKLGMNPVLWRKELLECGLIEVVLDGQTAIQASDLLDFHGDPADRMIVATALSTAATLVTADQKILDWDGLSQKINARH